MRDQYIFDIPIYRKSKNDYYTEIDYYIEKRVEWIISHDPERRPLDHEVRQRIYQRVVAESGGPWQFNQVVGWFRLFVQGNTIGCHPWWVDAKRINRRMRNKRLYLQTQSDILQARFRNESSNEIYSILLEHLVRLSKDNSYNNRYVDLNVFRRIGPFIDWHRLLFVRPDHK